MKLQSLNKDYKIFTNIVVFGAILISLLVLYFSYKDFNEKSQKIIIYTANKATLQLNESLSYIENISNFIGKQIVAKKNLKLEDIASILFNTKPEIDPETKDIFTWTLFDFIDSNNYVLASSSQGILEKPIYVTKEKRSWIEHSRKTPWKLLSSRTDIGILSKKPIIPFGFGITKENKEFVGIISFGIDVTKLQKKLESASNTPYITFAFLDRENSIVSKSSNFEQEYTTAIEEIIKETNPKQGFITVKDKQFYYQSSNIYQLKVLVGTNKKEFLSQLKTDFLPKALNTLYLVIFFLVLLYFFRAKLLNPVLKLSEAANKISHGKLDVVVPKSDIAEVNSLSIAIDKVKKFLIAEESVKRNLKSGKDNAESANYNKTEFLASTAHELKNMLSGIIGLGELIKMNLTGPSESIAELKGKEVENISWIIDIIKLGEESSTFVHDILDINQAQTGDFKIEAEELVDLRDIVLRSINLMKTRAIKEKKNIIVNFDKNDKTNFTSIKLDPRRIKQIIVNIVSNAIKYSPKNTDINVSLHHMSKSESDKINKIITENIRNNSNFSKAKMNRLLTLLSHKKNKHEAKIVIEIEDQGYGMDAEELKIATQKYNSIKHDPDSKIDSTGLGLSIVKSLVEEQCGLLEINSEKGKGTKVRIIF
jgi:signal transduction histidine kinase